MFQNIKRLITKNGLDSNIFKLLQEDFSSFDLTYQSLILQLSSRYRKFDNEYRILEIIDSATFDDLSKKISKDLIDLLFLIESTKGETIHATQYLSSKTGTIPSGGKIIGREKNLIKLASYLKKDSYKSVVLKGMGGIGKSTLASFYLAKFSHRYRCIIWVNYSGNILFDIINSVNDDEALGIQVDRKTKLLNKEFDKLLKSLEEIKEPILLIIDGINSITSRQEIKELLETLSNRNWQILITSRVDLKISKNLPVEVMDKEESIQLFLANCEINPSNENIKALVETVEFHPLAIDLIARTISANRNIKPEEFLNEIIESGILNIKTKPKLTTTHNDGEEIFLPEYFLSIFDISDLSHQEENLLTCLSILPSLAMDVEFLSDIWKHMDFTKNEFNATLEELLKKGWIKVDQNNNFSIHLIIKEVSKNKTEISFTYLKKISKYVILKTKTDFNNESLTSKMPWLPTLKYLIEENYKRANQMDLVDLLINSSMIYRHVGKNNKAKDQYELVLELDKKHNLLNDEKLNKVRGNIAIVYQNLEKYEEGLMIAFKAMKYYEKQKDKDELGLIYNKIGNLYNNSGNLEGGEKYYQKAIEEFQNVLYQNVARNNLATLFGNKLKKLSIELEIGKINDWNELEVLGNKNIVILEEVIQAYKDCGKLENDLWITMTKINLGTTLLKIGEIEKALSLLKFAEKEYLEIFKDSNHIDLLTIQGHLCEAYLKSNNFEAALSIILKVIKNSNSDSIAQGFNFISLGKVYEAMNKPNKATAEFRKAENHLDKNLKNKDSIIFEYLDYKLNTEK